MFTMVASRTTISWAIATMTRISQRWSVAAGGPEAAAGADMAVISPGRVRGGGLPPRGTREASRAGGGYERVRGGRRWGRGIEGVRRADHGRRVPGIEPPEDLMQQPLTRGGRRGQ